jgi:hypothetical protein
MNNKGKINTSGRCTYCRRFSPISDKEGECLISLEPSKVSCGQECEEYLPKNEKVVPYKQLKVGQIFTLIPTFSTSIRMVKTDFVGKKFYHKGEEEIQSFVEKTCPSQAFTTWAVILKSADEHPGNEGKIHSHISDNTWVKIVEE